MNHNQSGHWAEFLARSLFRLKGYRIIAQNYITGRGTLAGEVDFIASKNKTIVFVEVKKRVDLETAAYAISDKQKQRISNAAQAFIKKNPHYQNYDIRFDAVLVQLPLKINHIPNAWLS